MLFNFYRMLFMSIFSFITTELVAEQLNQNKKIWYNLYHNQNLLHADLDWDHLICSIELSPNVDARISSDVILEVPSHIGNKKGFRFYETSVLPPSLKIKYPNIKSYMGIGIENPSHRSSLVFFENGLYGLVIDENGHSYIEVDENHKATISDTDIYSKSSLNITCEINMQNNSSRDLNEDIFWDCVGTDEPCYPVGSTLTTYRFAGIMSERATNQVSDGTVDGGLAWMVAMVNQINLLWIRELSFKLEMVEESDQLIFTDNNPAPDVFQKDPSCHNSGDPKYCELEEIKPYLESVIGPGGDNTPQSERTWEYGAHFDTRYNGGVAYMPGSTSANNANYEVFNHELGHNLGSPHNISIEGGWRCTIGGTIMGSRVRTVSGFSGDQYSSHTIELAMNYRNDPMIYQNIGIWGSDYVTGYNFEETGNVIPEVVVPESGFIIPKETPFVLEGVSIPYNSDYTFSWEQNDASDESFSMNPLDNSLPFFLPNKGPLFSTVDPTLGGFKRYFPAIQSLLNNNYYTEINDYGTMLTVEKLPFASRELNMRLLVRTNDPYAGSLNHKNVEFFVDGQSGPFRITSQTEPVAWEIGSEQTITWDVANTDNPNQVNCQTVDILLSLDGGNNFDQILGENIPNNGLYTFFVPVLLSTSSARIMVKASENIFFDINNSFFTVNNPAIPTIVIDETPINIDVEVGAITMYQRTIENNGDELSVLSYNTLVDYDLDGDGFLSFDGFEDNVDLGPNLLDGTGDFSIALWFKSTGTEEQVLIQQRDQNNYIGQYQLSINQYGRISFFTYESSGYKWGANSFQTYNDGEWHHVVVVQSSELNGGALYVDGELINSSDAGVVNVNGGIRTYLGADMRDNNKFLQGSINDVSIFSSSLSGENINILYNRGFGFNVAYNHEGFNQSSSLIAFYPMVQMQGSTIVDFSINNFNGNIIGCEWGGDLVLFPSWLQVGNQINTLAYGESAEIDITLDANGLMTETSYSGKIIVNSEYETVIIPISINTVESLSSNQAEIVTNQFRLFNAYPNPFNPITTISYNLPEDVLVNITIYDMMGRTINNLVTGKQSSDFKSVDWNATDNFNQPVSAGIYLYRIEAGDFTQTKKMLLLK